MWISIKGVSPYVTLTCISTGGPATFITWTRDSFIVTKGTETVLDDPVTAQYTHTLTVIGRQGGLYTCTVANDKPSGDSASISIEGNTAYATEVNAIINPRRACAARVTVLGLCVCVCVCPVCVCVCVCVLLNISLFA